MLGVVTFQHTRNEDTVTSKHIAMKKKWKCVSVPIWRETSFIFGQHRSFQQTSRTFLSTPHQSVWTWNPANSASTSRCPLFSWTGRPLSYCRKSNRSAETKCRKLKITSLIRLHSRMSQATPWHAVMNCESNSQQESLYGQQRSLLGTCKLVEGG